MELLGDELNKVNKSNANGKIDFFDVADQTNYRKIINVMFKKYFAL